jgi:ribosomal protein S18 acetylase RimI-like enzyme
MNEIKIERASEKDIEKILALQKIAYVSEAEIINDFTIPPLHQTTDEILSEFSYQTFLKVELKNKVVGSIRAYLKNGTCYIGKLIVHPDYQNIGIGTKLLNAAELKFQEAKRYELFTGKKSEKNLYIYKKNGYRIFRQQKISKKLTFVFLEKTNDIAEQTAPPEHRGRGTLGNN